METYHYLIQNFFTHKDFLVPASRIPGTLFTPLHFAFSALVLALVVSSALFVARRKKLIRPVFALQLAVLVILEVLITYWDSTAGLHPGLDLRSSLSLYPCSIFMYAMPFAIWGKGKARTAACGYVCTLGLMGAAVNFFYPAIRLATYSCISLPGFHTFFYHGSMLFTCLVMLLSGYHRYSQVNTWKDLFLPCIPTLLLSIPANLVNYTIHADYMFFRGEFPLVAALFRGLRDVEITVILYFLYIFIPALFYLPAYVARRRSVSLLPRKAANLP